MSHTPDAPFPYDSGRTLRPEQEPVRCTVCGLGAAPSDAPHPARHIVSTVAQGCVYSDNVPADHDAVCDNIDPSGHVFTYARITATQTLGPYHVITTERVTLGGDVETRYYGYIDSSAIRPTEWQRAVPMVVRTGYAHETLEEAIAFLIAYGHRGPNEARPLARHFVSGLAD